jgi:two-component system OmpR family response regulator
MFDPTTRLRAVVVDSDSDDRLLIRRSLEMKGFAVTEAGSASEALLDIQKHRPDVVTLDLDLPDMDGVEVCRTLRKFSDAYVIMITARVDEVDELIGLEAGADDFIGKPFSPRLLQARVTAVLRRHRPTPQRPTPLRRASDYLPVEADNSSGNQPIPHRRASDAAAVAGDNSAAPATPATDTVDVDVETMRVARHGPLVLELESRIASLEGVELALTRTEFQLLEVLASAPRRVWTRKALLMEVWSSEWALDEHLVEVHIGNLRRKLGAKGRQTRLIRTVRGVGYRLAPAEEVS